MSHAHLKQTDNAIRYFTNAINICPVVAVYRHERAKCYLLTDEFKLSIEDLNFTIQKQPQNSLALYARGFAFKVVPFLSFKVLYF